MSKTFSTPVQFTCTHGCQTFGVCPGHELRVTLKHTSDHVAIEERNLGVEGWTETGLFDDNRWCAILNAYHSLSGKPMIIPAQQGDEREQVKSVAEAARSFLKCYDEFNDQPECCGEYLEALITATDKLGD